MINLKKKLTEIINLYNKKPVYEDFLKIKEYSELIQFNVRKLDQLYKKFCIQLKIHISNLCIREEIIQHLDEFDTKIISGFKFKHNKYLWDFLGDLMNVKIDSLNPLISENRKREVFKKYDLDYDSYYKICTILFCYSFESVSISTKGEIIFFMNIAGNKISGCKFFDKYKLLI